MDILNYLKQSKHLWIIPAYGIFYMISFMLMEQSDVKIHMIHSLADDKIPFCPYFIIPYVLWYFFLIGTVIYFAVFCPSKKEYYQYLGTLGVGMTLFLLISYVYPNGQHLRPDLGSTGGGVFISVIRFLYKIDTPTNIFPSMHVFNATASCIALYQNERCRKNKLFTVSQIILTISIVLSTMFLKQHSVADVMTALILNILCYQLFYRVLPARKERLAEVLTRREICTVPNLLSTLRLCLAVVFFGIFERYGVGEYRTVLVLLILAAAATDVLDGRIARSFNSISQVGRILDPVADKAMQGVMIAYLIPRYPLAKLVLILNILCYQLFYRVLPARKERLAEVLTRREICTVPNLLSTLRLCLAVVFFGIFERYGVGEYRTVLVLLILAAAATDVLDGRIARSFNSISQVGRILDPVADKAMQGVMIAYLIPRYPLAKLVLILFVIKECYMTVAGWKVLMETKETIEAQWHGKLNTAVTYVVVLILLAGPRLPYSTSNVLIGACAVCMAMSLSMYAAQFREMLEHQNGRYQRKMQGGFSGN